MPTNANTFNSRVTSESLEAKFRQVFPAQGGAELVQDLFASGVIQPVVDFSSVAEGSVLTTDLQTAWDFSTGSNQVSATTTTVISNPGFWLCDLTATYEPTDAAVAVRGTVFIDDGASTKNVWGISCIATTSSEGVGLESNKFVVFLRAGDSLKVNSVSNRTVIDIN